MEVGVIVAAAGPGTRLGMGSKALVRLNGRTMLARVVEILCSLDEIDRVVVVGPPGRLDLVRAEARSVSEQWGNRQVTVCAGGDTRQQSVRAGLRALGPCDYVLVHDAARPMTSPALVRRVLRAAAQTGAAIPALPARDALVRVEHGRLVESVPRDRLVCAQTPQAFRRQVLERAHFEAADAGLEGDDDAQLVAAAGHEVAVVPGERTNVELATPEDFELLDALLRAQDEPRAGARPLTRVGGRE